MTPMQSESSPANVGAPKHRADIDGLRALAVLPVVAYHAGVHAMRGGFVGVDIFFVISGYLITEILVRDIRARRFSIVAFYERRIRRIFPALISMLLATLVLGTIYCLPDELVALAKSAIAAALSASNVYFWMDSGYFSGTALAKPLLHTWSLAVEEQFYIFWPLFLLLGQRYFSRHLLRATVYLASASLLVSAIGAFRFPEATFYLPFTRTWELAAGGLLTMPRTHLPIKTIPRNLLAAAGALLILGSILWINADMPFPGLAALPPCLGAVFILAAGRDGTSLVGRLLSLKPITFIGLISYSLYLWHWPITVFQKNDAFLFSGMSERTDKILVVLVSLGVATVSWRFIEQPFRTGRFRPSDTKLAKMAVTGIALVLIAAAVDWSAHGFPGRFSKMETDVAAYVHYDPDKAWRVDQCFLTGKDSLAEFPPQCLALSTSMKNYLLLGDSHAAQMWAGLQASYPGINFLQATASDCFPTIEHGVTEAAKCVGLINGIYTHFLVQHKVDRVLLVARWKPNLSQIAATLDWLKAHDIPATLVGPIPVFDSPVPRLLISALRTGDAQFAAKHLDDSIYVLDERLAELAKAHGTAYVSLADIYCSHRICHLTDEHGMPIIFDQEHWTVEWAKDAVHKIDISAD